MNKKKVPTHLHSQDFNPRSHPPFTNEFLYKIYQEDINYISNNGL